MIPAVAPGVYPIVDSELHLACYDIEPKSDHDLFVSTRDQFDDSDLQIRTNELLCVPSEKLAWYVPTLNVPALSERALLALTVLMTLTTLVWLGLRRRRVARSR